MIDSCARLRRNVCFFALAAVVSACSGEKNHVAASSGAPTATSSAGAAPTTAEASASPTSTASADASAPAAEKTDDLNVLVIGVDAMRADHLEFGGHNPEVMPTLNAFEKTAVSFTNFHSLSSFTAQSVGGFLGCRYPSELKRNGSFFAVYPEEETMFPELLQKAGIKTMSAHAHFYFQKGRAGFDQGFDTYEIVPGIKKNNTTDESITSPAHTEIILKHLADKANTSGRFFAFYHLLDAHDQYLAHPEGKDFGKGAKNMYDGELYFVDMHIKKILDYVDSQPWGKRTMVIITSDHGEAFGEHKQYRHAFELWNNLTHVPLMIRAPGLKPRRISEVRSAIDVCPTILDTFGVKLDASYQGTSLLPELKGGPSEPRDVVSELARDSNNDRKRTLIRGDWKIIEIGNEGGYQLFNLKEDPKEENDLSRKNKEKFAEMKEALKTMSGKIKEICPKKTEGLKGKPKGKPC
ncbi:MAG: sulfatase [Polyangiaceae bacterium]|nr:sulfatase [Polyangiaceae bacterium]